MNRVFVLTGPESSGKTWLAEKISQELEGTLVLEYAREYLNENGSTYSERDVEIIAQEQKQRIDRAAKDHSLVIADTGPLVLKIWMEYRFNKTSSFIEDWWKTNNYHYILCRPDLDWEYDPLRENPDNRDDLFSKYYLCLRSWKKDFTLVEGQTKRLSSALNWIKSGL